MNWLPDLLSIVENALRNPSDKAAVQIAIDGLAAWHAVSDLPTVQKLEADVAAYVATLPPGAAPDVPEPSIEAGAHGGSIYTGPGATR